MRKKKKYLSFLLFEVGRWYSITFLLGFSSLFAYVKIKKSFGELYANIYIICGMIILISFFLFVIFKKDDNEFIDFSGDW